MLSPDGRFVAFNAPVFVSPSAGTTLAFTPDAFSLLYLIDRTTGATATFDPGVLGRTRRIVLPRAAERPDPNSC